MDLLNKKIGIWGFGIVGKSALNYVYRQSNLVQILDSRPLSDNDAVILTQKNVPFFLQDTFLFSFLDYNDYIIASPGIDLRPYRAYNHKFIGELDLFCHNYHKPIIAITGTNGKTSITHLLAQLLQTDRKKSAVGGNIGTPMLDLLNQESDRALLELSSFQLERSTTLTPALAIITNFSSNHLDRHDSIEDYFNAKYRIVANQTQHDRAILPIKLMPTFYTQYPVQSTCTFICPTIPTNQEINELRPSDSLCFMDQESIILYSNKEYRILFKREELPIISYPENWLIICMALYHLNIPFTVISSIALNVPEHRLEKIDSIKSIDVYNDSKSTTPPSTLAAIEKLKGKPLHLFLGGISKGIDRAPLIQQLRGKTSHIYCFGKEASLLHELCLQYGIDSSSYDTLDAAVKACIQKSSSGDQILFSPAGASFDLFNHYAHRGDYFKKLIAQIE